MPAHKTNRGNTTHGCHSLIRTGRLPSNKRKLRWITNNIRRVMLAEIAGPAGPTAAQSMAVETAVFQYLVIRLFQSWAWQTGVMIDKPDGFINSSVGDKYLSWNRTLIQTLSAIGIDRRVIDDAILVEMLAGVIGPVRDGETEPVSGSLDVEPSGSAETVGDVDADVAGTGVKRPQERRSPAGPCVDAGSGRSAGKSAFKRLESISGDGGDE